MTFWMIVLANVTAYLPLIVIGGVVSFLTERMLLKRGEQDQKKKQEAVLKIADDMIKSHKDREELVWKQYQLAMSLVRKWGAMGSHTYAQIHRHHDENGNFDIDRSVYMDAEEVKRIFNQHYTEQLKEEGRILKEIGLLGVEEIHSAKTEKVAK